MYPQMPVWWHISPIIRCSVKTLLVIFHLRFNRSQPEHLPPPHCNSPLCPKAKIKLLVKTPFDVRSCFEMSLPAAFSLYIVTNILHEQKGFQAHFNQIQDQSWSDILDFTLLPFMWSNKNTSQLSQLHSHVHVTVNVSTHCTFPSIAFTSAFCTNTFHFSSLWNCHFLDLNCSFFQHGSCLPTKIPAICSYLY